DGPVRHHSAALKVRSRRRGRIPPTHRLSAGARGSDARAMGLRAAWVVVAAMAAGTACTGTIGQSSGSRDGPGALATDRPGGTADARPLAPGEDASPPSPDAGTSPTDPD